MLGNLPPFPPDPDLPEIIKKKYTFFYLLSIHLRSVTPIKLNIIFKWVFSSQIISA